LLDFDDCELEDDTLEADAELADCDDDDDEEEDIALVLLLLWMVGNVDWNH
jgi:hypothetical protein